MIKHLFMAGLLTVGASAAYAQQATTPPRAADPQVAAMPSGADAKKLIGRNVKNPQDETVGEIESVYINADGKVDSVILGVGGFLGVGERHVRVAWKDLRISDNGEKVVINATKDELKGMAPYTYRDAKQRGQVFTDTGVYAPAAASRPEGHRHSDRIHGRLQRPRRGFGQCPDRRQGPQRRQGDGGLGRGRLPRCQGRRRIRSSSRSAASSASATRTSP